MNEKRTALLTVCLLGAFLLTFSLWAYLKPDDAFSQSERRKLTPKPSCTVESIYSGRYMSDFETYAPDQFPLREQFRTLRSLTSLYLLRQRDTNGVYLAEGYVSRLEYPMQEDSIAHAARRFDYLYDTYLSGTNCRLYLSVIPDKNAFLASSHGYPALDYGAFTQSLRKKTPYLTYLPIGDLLSLEDYYRTDLHWRQEQLTDVAARLLEGMGAEAPAPSKRRLCPPPTTACTTATLPCPWSRTLSAISPMTPWRAAPSTTTRPARPPASTMGRRAPGGTPTSGSSPAPSPC